MQEFKIKRNKKFISLFLIFSLMMLSVNLYAKEKRGAKLLITKKDGQQVEGKLITVKTNSLLLLNTEGKDVSARTADIKVIRVVMKSKALSGAGIGLVAGGAIGALLGLMLPEDGRVFCDPGWLCEAGYSLNMSRGAAVAAGAIGFGVLGIPIGAIIGAIAGTDKIIQVQGMTDSKTQKTLDKLRKKARVHDYK